MEEITISICDIKDISKGRITYSLAGAEARYIDLERCRKNWVDHVNASESFRDKNGLKPFISLDTSRYIGTSNTIHEDPCIVFYEDVHVKVVIGSMEEEKNKEALTALRRMLSEGSYMIWDMT